MAVGYDGTIRIDTKVDDKKFNSGVAGMNKSVGGLTKSVGKLGIAMGVAFAVKALIDFGTKSVKVASDIAEVQNVVEVAFGGMTEAANKFADEALEKLGMSELTAKRASSTFMVMGKSMGIASERSAEMAFNMTELVGDVASFYNLTQDVAETALKSVYTGETETLLYSVA